MLGAGERGVGAAAPLQITCDLLPVVALLTLLFTIDISFHFSEVQIGWKNSHGCSI